jgi:foldase protein PrsA
MRKFLAISLVALAPIACRPISQTSEPAAVVVPASPTAGAAAATQPAAGGAMMAMVNGQPIYMAQLHEILVRGQGLEMAQQLVVSEIIRQEANRRGLAATEAQAQAEHSRLAADLWPTVAEADQKERLLAQLLVEKGWSRIRWDMVCRRNALLRQMVEPGVAVTDEMLRAEYADQFGQKAVVRHIEVESLDEAERVLKEVKAKADFASLAKKYSKNPSAVEGGLLPPMTRAAPPAIPDAIRQVAVSLQAPGDVSEPVKVGYAFHILRLERIIEPTTVPSDQAKAKIRDALRERLVRQAQQRLMQELLQSSRSEFADPLLRELEAGASQPRP